VCYGDRVVAYILASLKRDGFERVGDGEPLPILQIVQDSHLSKKDVFKV
jgi:hypothetical protein